ncbi:MAG: hypothetical protein AAF443_02610 [Chlamydiota bacterium]
MIWRGYFDRLFSWVLIRQVDKTQGKIGQKGPPNALRFFHFESARVYTTQLGLKHSPGLNKADKNSSLKREKRIYTV